MTCGLSRHLLRPTAHASTLVYLQARLVLRSPQSAITNSHLLWRTPSNPLACPINESQSLHTSAVEGNCLAWPGFEPRPAGNLLKSSAHYVKPPRETFDFAICCKSPQILEICTSLWLQSTFPSPYTWSLVVHAHISVFVVGDLNDRLCHCPICSSTTVDFNVIVQTVHKCTVGSLREKAW